jgi:hypothetical protein
LCLTFRFGQVDVATNSQRTRAGGGFEFAGIAELMSGSQPLISPLAFTPSRLARLGANGPNRRILVVSSVGCGAATGSESRVSPRVATTSAVVLAGIAAGRHCVFKAEP